MQKGKEVSKPIDQNQTILAIAKEMEHMRETTDRIHALFVTLVISAGIEVIDVTSQMF